MKNCMDRIFLFASSTLMYMFVSLGLLSCSHWHVKKEQLQEVSQNAEYDKVVAVDPEPVTTAVEINKQGDVTAEAKPVDTKASAAGGKLPGSGVTTKHKSKKSKALEVAVDGRGGKAAENDNKEKEKEAKAAREAAKHEPDIEDGEGFIGRRPIVDPYRLNEKVVLDLSYFGINAGKLTMFTTEMRKVNGQLSYHFRLAAKSNDSFSFIYTVDDYAETFLDYRTLLPHNYVIKINEKKSVGENRAVFDPVKLQGWTWEKRITSDNKKDEKKFEWQLEPFAQNVLSVSFYLRAFQLTTGKKIVVRVADRGKNMIMTAEVVNREVLDTDIGKIKTVVVRPSFQLDGIFKPVGDIRLWLTDDEQKLIVRIESKIKIGTIVGSLSKLERGTPFPPVVDVTQ